VHGSVTSQNVCGVGKPYTLYFQMQFSSPAASHGTFTSGAATGLHAQATRLSVVKVGPHRLPPAFSAAALGTSDLAPTAAQRWLASPVGQLKNAATGRCLAATRDGRVRQADAATARCTGVVYQRWTVPYTAAITP
jgi:hypothetical protein